LINLHSPAVTGIAARRLHAQRLTGDPFVSPVEAVRRLTAVQAQDYAGAKWALGQRSRGTTEADLDRMFDAGAILRTHVMRPTWHFVAPEDIRWLLRLTGLKVNRSLTARHRSLELDESTVLRARAAFTSALEGGHHLTRPELGEVLRAAGVSPEGQRLPHLLMAAELDALIVSGPRRGKQFTYALLEERAPLAPVLDRAEAVTELARRYFQSHGPAQLQDFVWWSGLTMTEARAGIAAAGAALEKQSIEGKEYWFDEATGPAYEAAGVAHLLPNFDEYSVAYRDRAAMLEPGRPFEPALFAFGSILANVVTIGGGVRGSWRRTVARGSTRVEIRLLHRLPDRDVVAIEEAARAMSRFLERPVELKWL
jgi:Winged helix DNA-binding domain